VSGEPSELDRLLAGEIERRIKVLASPTTALADLRAALHSLKGSSAMAGHAELALVIGQLGARLRLGEAGARDTVLEVLRAALARLQSGAPPFPTTWPEPPPALGPSEVDPRYSVEYHTAMRDRLGELDSVLADTGPSTAALEHAQRAVHAMKGASAAVGDDVVAWYCHGLETGLRKVAREERVARDAVVDLARHRALLALLIEDSARGIETLRLLAAPPEARQKMPAPKSAPPLAPPSSPPARPELEDPTLRIGRSALERILERLERIDSVPDELGSSAEIAMRMSSRLSELRLAVLGALRRIGPPRPWGPPAAALAELESVADSLRRSSLRAKLGAVAFRGSATAVRAATRSARTELRALRQSSMSWLFERVGSAVVRYADTQGKLVRVEIAGADVVVDRSIAERLYDPVLQLARNAIAHGIQSPERREAAGKPPLGTVWLKAERDANFLRVVVEDDGQGADVELVQRLAVSRGFANEELLQSTPESELMALLFLPGMSTQEGADLLAGRGVGLDLAQDTARRLGGSAHVRNRPGGGFSATLEVPSDQSVVDVLWLEEQGSWFALPVGYTGRVRLAPEASTPRLAACLGNRVSGRARYALDLITPGVRPIPIGVDRVGAVEEANLRPVPPLVAAAGPFAGAVLRADGALRLVLDGPALAARARVLSQRHG
jgi:two-component system chemotaxis sensor kinase CheA